MRAASYEDFKVLRTERKPEIPCMASILPTEVFGGIPQKRISMTRAVAIENWWRCLTGERKIPFRIPTFPGLCFLKEQEIMSEKHTLFEATGICRTCVSIMKEGLGGQFTVSTGR